MCYLKKHGRRRKPLMIRQTAENIQGYMTKIEGLLKVGARYLIDNLGNNSVEIKKGNRDFALTVDVELEKIYRQSLAEVTPDIPILGEELSPKNCLNGYRGKFWAIDPIDGTINYSKGLPEYGTSIALIENGTSVAVGVCLPSLQETYIAGINEGAFLNKKRIQVSDTSDLINSVLAYGDFSVKHNYEIENEVRFKYITSFANNVLRVRMPGSAALQLAWLASGRIDISLTLSNNAWDVQGGVLLVREAGGCVYDFDGSEHSILSKYTIASNKKNKGRVIEFISNIE